MNVLMPTLVANTVAQMGDCSFIWLKNRSMVWGGGVCPVPTLPLNLPSPRGAPQVGQSGPQTFPTKHNA